MPESIWKDIPEFKGKVKASSNGEIKKGGKILSQRDRNGYLAVNVCIDGIEKTYSVHRLVASAFIKNDNNKPTVNHINGDKKDNRVENLCWATWSENNQHAHDESLNKGPFGSKQHLSKLTEELVLDIRAIPKYFNIKNKELAQAFNVHAQTIGDVLKHKTWNHI